VSASHISVASLLSFCQKLSKLWKFDEVLTRTNSQFFVTRCTVKHALQNTQNDYHQWLSDNSRVHQIRFRPPGEHTALPQTM